MCAPREAGHALVSHGGVLMNAGFGSRGLLPVAVPRPIGKGITIEALQTRAVQFFNEQVGEHHAGKVHVRGPGAAGRPPGGNPGCRGQLQSWRSSGRLPGRAGVLVGRAGGVVSARKAYGAQVLTRIEKAFNSCREFVALAREIVDATANVAPVKVLRIKRR